ncbi:MAG: hypothetical protein ABR562_00535 [Thermoplasmatota archaeon]|nr:hypothetical protein [Halobacteriales archaeon]
MPWRDSPSLQCPLCDAAFRASSAGLRQRILNEHVVGVHGAVGREALRTLDPL